jgi:hypothetical protein
MFERAFFAFEEKWGNCKLILALKDFFGIIPVLILEEGLLRRGQAVKAYQGNLSILTLWNLRF